MNECLTGGLARLSHAIRILCAYHSNNLFATGKNCHVSVHDIGYVTLTSDAK